MFIWIREEAHLLESAIVEIYSRREATPSCSSLPLFLSSSSPSFSFCSRSRSYTFPFFFDLPSLPSPRRAGLCLVSSSSLHPWISNVPWHRLFGSPTHPGGPFFVTRRRLLTVMQAVNMASIRSAVTILSFTVPRVLASCAYGTHLFPRAEGKVEVNTFGYTGNIVSSHRRLLAHDLC